MVPISKEFVFQYGYVSNKDRICFITNHEKSTSQEFPNAQLYLFRNGKDWSQTVVKWASVGLTSVLQPVPTIVVLGRDGEVLIGTSKGYREEQINDLGASPLRRGPMRNIRAISGTVFAVGMARQVYRRLGDNTWARYEEGLPVDIPPLKVAGFNSIDGAAIDDIYSVGWGGEIWHHDGTLWLPEESPTNLALFDVLAISASKIYACGQAGTLLQGRSGLWEVVEFEGPRPTFRSMAWFQDKLYLADGQALFTLENGELSVVDFGVGVTVPSGHLHTGDGILLSVAGKEVFMTTDAVTWVPLPI